MKEKLDVKNMTDEELRKNLITSDFRGRDFKTACLEEIIYRTQLKLTNQLNETKKGD